MNHRGVRQVSMDSPLAWGTVGWLEDEGTSFYDLGDSSGTGSETALTLVHVTLVRGRDATQALDQTRAQGQRIVCQISAPEFCVPPLGTQVIVALPGDHRHLPGAAVIVAAVDSRGSAVYGSSYQAGDKSIVAFLAFAQLLLQANGKATLQTRQGNTSEGQPVGVVADVDGSVNVKAQTVNVGNNATDGVVLQTLLASQLTKLSAALGATGGILSDLVALYGVTIGGPPPSTANINAFIASLTTPNYSSSVKAQQ